MFEKFKISVLFDWQNGNTDLKKEHINGKGHPVVSSGVENTGIIGCTDVDARILPAHTITVDMFGNVYYRDFEYKEVTHARVFTLIPKGFELDVQTGLYFVSSLKVLSKIYSYDNMCSYAKMSNMDISLPVIENSNPDHEYTVDDIDWQYMRDRITELERDRITELDAYLQATGLNDYELTEEDKKILSLSAKRASDENRTLEDNSEDEVRFRKFVMHDIFEPLTVKKAVKANVRNYQDNEFCVPVVYAKFGDNGIMYWGRKNEFTTYSNVLSIVYNGVIAAGKCYAQEDETGILAESYLIRYKNGEVPFLANLYMSKVIEHKIYPLYSRENLAIWNNRVENEIIELPIKSDGTPNFDYMERYIRAMEKVVIADVVKYKDKIIETTKKVVGE